MAKKIDGTIGIHTENILPIIKKWLYSEKEIFIRELISNAFDAISKLHHIVNVEEVAHKPEVGKINLVVNKDKRTLTFEDNGLGMDAKEVQKYINQIAFSGAEDFISKYQEGEDKKTGIVGHFGLGFYSSFMVADKVQIKSLSYKDGAKPVLWTNEGSSSFTLEVAKKSEVGTQVILYLNEDESAFLEDSKLEELVKKYANFLSVDIQVNGKSVNHKDPLWIKQPSEVKEEEYISFYETMFPRSPKPLFWIHLNVDYPFNLKGILYFPQVLHEMDVAKGQVQLFCQQVYVSENVKEVIPEFLTLLKGAIDCPDIPLNVSRSFLQNEPYVQKISKHIVKKVADKLKAVFVKNREDYNKYWKDIHAFIKYGMMQEDDFYKRVKDYVVFESASDKVVTLEEYKDAHKDTLKDTLLYCGDRDNQLSYVELCQSQGFNVLYVNSLIDSHFLQFLESKDSNLKFKSVDSDLTDLLSDDPTDMATQSDAKAEGKEGDSKKEEPLDPIAQIFNDVIKDDKLTVKVTNLKDQDVPALLIESEQSKRLKAMSQMFNAGPGMGMDMFKDHTLLVNKSNPIVKKLFQKSQSKTADKNFESDVCHHIYDLAQMSLAPLKGTALQTFLKRSQKLMGQLFS